MGRSREAGGIAADGVVYPGVDARLLPRPDLDLDGVRRGELAVCTPRAIGEYFLEPALTAAAFVEIDGKRYFRTGDIAELVQRPDGGTQVELRGRCGASIKLSQVPGCGGGRTVWCAFTPVTFPRPT